MQSVEPSLEALEWLVEYRSKNQSISLNLYKLLEEHDKTLRNNQNLHTEAQRLVAISFSLWRSVFLSEGTDSPEAAYKSAKGFLAKLVQDNAIGYPQDKEHRGWTFYYYLRNAEMRLNEISNKYNDQKCRLPKSTECPAKNRWIDCHKALCDAIEEFRKKLTCVTRTP